MIILFMCMYVCTCMPLTHEGQERESARFELELHMALSHYMSTGTRTLVLWKSNSALSH